MKWGTVVEGNERRYGSLFNEVELWMLPVQRVESALKAKERNRDQMHLSYSTAFFDSVKTANYRVYTATYLIGPMSRQEWLRTREDYRKILLAIAMLDRELKYRRDRDYRALIKILQEKKNDKTTQLILADRCDELGYFVMARRLRWNATATPSQKRARTAGTRRRY